MKIFIKNLEIKMIVGVFDRERTNKQKIHFDIEIDFDSERAEKSDNICDTIDYKTIVDNIEKNYKDTKFFLLETLISRIADDILKEKLVNKVTISVHKGKIFKNTDFVSLITTKKRD